MSGGLDKELPVPLYHQLQAVLKAEIESRNGVRTNSFRTKPSSPSVLA